MVLIIHQIKFTVLQAIKVGSGSKEKMGFKRSKHLEKKLKVGFVCAYSVSLFVCGCFLGVILCLKVCSVCVYRSLIICVWLFFRSYILKFVLFVHTSVYLCMAVF